MLRGRGPPQHLNSDIVIKFWPPETREGVCQELSGHQERVHAGDDSHHHHFHARNHGHPHQAGRQHHQAGRHHHCFHRHLAADYYDHFKRPVRHAGCWVDWRVEGKGLLIPEDDNDDDNDNDNDDGDDNIDNGDDEVASCQKHPFLG